MYTIGQFAQLTGLTVKALRHYGATGLLAPDHVDEFSGYRFYAPGQVRDAATLSLLRTMEVPLPLVRVALASPDRLAEIVDAFEEDRRARRALEDRIAAEVRGVLDGYDRRTEVVYRDVPEQPWVGLRSVVDIAEPDDEGVEAFNESFNAFFREAYESGLAPLGHWWLEFQQAESETEYVTLSGIPVATLPDAPLTRLPEGASYAQGVDPARRLAAAEVQLAGEGGPDMTALTSAPHPAVLALIEAGIGDDGPLRQVYTPTNEGMRLEVVGVAPDGR
ncbi:MerR family DNA-binding transcriptional regulator [Nigerium massiliense]|uniref:MerR family DNA-binding transcriptional regulator n=1 Tax=Nigerium massiliense TaxID=1522317 RepID=UPI000693B950|nr:MerR family DNA-binding transcriptional regulator [Nigerium massiliense]